VPIGHVEAGLRTGNLYSPWPEEANRVLTSRLAALHFAPTEKNRQNLLQEGIPSEDIVVTGNTVIDSLFIALDKIKLNPPEIPGLAKDLLISLENRPLVLITGHRRENFGPGFKSICQAIAELSRRFPSAHFVYPVHLNPNVKNTVYGYLKGKPNIHLIEPVSYLPFVWLMKQSTLILTDSGGVQEEAPSLGKPVLVMREETERPEAVDSGAAKLVGTSKERIIDLVTSLLTDRSAYTAMATSRNPYGDGKATGRILAACESFLEARH
jgi:UDP-N-acetylglucosamine 2-epimerase (non-hydrolysing)